MSLLQLCDGLVDLERGSVRRQGMPDATLTTRENELLRALSAVPGLLLGKDELLERIWGYSQRVRTRTVDTTLFRLRAAIESGSAAHVITVRGQGVRFMPPGTSAGVDAEAPLDALSRALDDQQATVTVHGPAGAGKSGCVLCTLVARGAPFAWVDLSRPHGPLFEHLEAGTTILVLDQAHAAIDVARAAAVSAPTGHSVVVTSSTALNLSSEHRIWRPASRGGRRDTLTRSRGMLSPEALVLLDSLTAGNALGPGDLAAAGELARQALLDPGGRPSQPPERSA